jgi:hypothetical protein
MAAFYPYDIEGYGGSDSQTITTLNGVDLGSRLPGDVLTSLMYAAPDGSVNPALGKGCDPRRAAPVDEARAAALRDPTGVYALAADPKAVARSALRAHQAKVNARGPVAPDDGGRFDAATSPARRPPYSSRSVVQGVTRCECQALQERARQQGRLRMAGTDLYHRYDRDLHGNDRRWFSDRDRVLFEFLDMANASTLAVTLTQAGVLEAPQFPLKVLAGRTAPCACSLLGPNLVHRAYLFVADDVERIVIDRYNPEDRSMGAALAKLNRRVVAQFVGDQGVWSRGDALVERARAMAKDPSAGAGSWSYEPLAAREPSRGRTNLVSGNDANVGEVKRAVATKIAARYGYVLTPDGRLVE